ncbi:MAG: sigma-70 family RNA polymerase sigma factor [Actinomycetota bacterium]|nr:sigma-70 family RNA polymerase sigma factor [Actinomycetota bacterium]
MDIQKRAEQIAAHIGLVHHVARRFRGSSDYEDLVQVGIVGLIHAVDHFDPAQGTSFSSYAVPSITGAILHHLRDHSSSVKVPGRLQELVSKVSRAVDHLTQHHGRSPTVAEIAEEVATSQEAVLEAIEANYARSTVSLEAEDAPPAVPAAIDTDFEEVETRLVVLQALSGLPGLDRRVIEQRFYRGRTQSQIAEDLQLSQMQVSRIISRSLTQLRQALADI